MVSPVLWECNLLMKTFRLLSRPLCGKDIDGTEAKRNNGQSRMIFVYTSPILCRHVDSEYLASSDTYHFRTLLGQAFLR